MDKIRALYGEEAFASHAREFELAQQLFDQLVVAPEFAEFLTLGAYPHLD
jgi:hypothetical protein